MSIYDPVSPSDTYIIYDQFHFLTKDHLEVPVKGWEEAVEQYRFYKDCYPHFSIGLCTVEYYNHLRNRIKNG